MLTCCYITFIPFACLKMRQNIKNGINLITCTRHGLYEHDTLIPPTCIPFFRSVTETPVVKGKNPRLKKLVMNAPCIFQKSKIFDSQVSSVPAGINSIKIEMVYDSLTVRGCRNMRGYRALSFVGAKSIKSRNGIKCWLFEQKVDCEVQN